MALLKIYCTSIDLSTSIARVMMAADFTIDNISAPLLTNNATVDDELAYNSTRDQVNLEPTTAPERSGGLPNDKANLLSRDINTQHVALTMSYFVHICVLVMLKTNVVFLKEQTGKWVGHAVKCNSS